MRRQGGRVETVASCAKNIGEMTTEIMATFANNDGRRLRTHTMRLNGTPLTFKNGGLFLKKR